MQVCFVALPFHNIENPVLSLSLLQSCLKEKQISSQIIYANMDYASVIGLQAYYAIAHGGSCREALMGEFVFSRAAFEKPAVGYTDFLERELLPYIGAPKTEELLQYLLQAEAAAEGFLQQTVAQVLAAAPAIVACASSTQQNCVCLAFLRLLKKQAPDMITILGGPNCERIMGKSLAESFPGVDYVISGEADSFWGDFCQKLLEGQRVFPEYPGIFTAAGSNDPQAAGFTADLDNMPYPDFDDYFKALQSFPYKEYVNTGLLIETSRGCWWGEKNPCTFCGMNGASRSYRKKSARRVLEEFRFLSERYGVKRFFAVDCVLAQEFWQDVLPSLQALELEIMYEIKTNVTASQLQLLQPAGISWVQPGIESLQDGLLRLMHKGNSAIRHVELLKQLTELGVRCCWLILCAFPGEDISWYPQQLEIMKLLTHLQPPDAVFRLRYDRFSVYEQNEAEYGLLLEAAPAYFYIYPEKYHGQLRKLAYFLVDAKNRQPLYGQGFLKKEHRDNYLLVEAWRQRFRSPFKDRLTAKNINEALEIIDLRKCASGSFYKLLGCEKMVAVLAVEVVSLAKLREQLQEEYSIEEIGRAVASLLAKKLLLQINDEVLFLAVFEERQLPDEAVPPAGSIQPAAFYRR